MPRPSRFTLLSSFAVALRGLREAVFEQRNVRIQIAAAAVVNLLAAWLKVSATEWLVLWLCIALVLTAELLNTAIETVVDLASPEQHELARKSKDIAAGAVLLVSMISAGIGLTVFIPPLLKLLRSGGAV
ncbi:diacylglycerol kinase family protein [Planctomicrobium piriforme]|uniref:Undecaprenol kinase/diacylglycerol kinase (ATP) n=1 Tax=Planctomicrobium piriforme TaxID=1576369 RepID=A0A1I3S6G5_9PLAN|nr:diacylglycerol kinase family protein [Planctomicrobium piriforme]SFJ54404.1 undecaprenol kinase/diacylglycerol kinase (ATP) [Planctomicrobium piriforme]